VLWKYAARIFIQTFITIFCLLFVELHILERHWLILKSMRFSVVLICCFLSFTAFSQPNTPKIGLTLSGGGAKGLFHIGILQAIDSAGLNIDYITGTSMGSIMGALYASGYSGNDMVRIARQMDWTAMFTGKALFENVNIDEKSEFNQYALEIPFQEKKLKLRTGLIEGQELWLKFQELFLPVYNIKDFSKLSIPFRCVATDLSNGQAVVLDQGEIIMAIRASMAIPSIFTAIDYKDTKLVDGGVVRNFPVRDVKDMGSDITIGVNLSQALAKADQLNSAVDVIYQIAFFKDADDFAEERKLCNVLIEPPMDDYSAGSFGSSEELLALGKEWGRKYYPVFKKLADSLRLINPDYHFRQDRLPKYKKIVIDDFEFNGLKTTTKTSFHNRLNLKAGQEYDGVEIAKAVRKVFGTLNYNRIAYRWDPTTDGHARLVFDVIENPKNYLKLGLHFNTFGNVALTTTLASKNFLADRSKAIAKFNISENFRMLLQQNQSFGKQENNNVIFSFYHERMNLPIYREFEQKYLYRNRFSQADVKVQRTFGRHTALGTGMSWENYRLRPKVAGVAQVEAANTYWHSYLYYERNTLNQKHFPTSGWKINSRLGVIFHQRPDDLFLEINDSTGIGQLSFENYGQLRINIENFKPINAKFTLLTQLNTGMNLKDNQSFLNFFAVGGLTDFLRNQITFAGLNEYEVHTNSIAVLMTGLQYSPFTNLYTTLRANIALYDFTYELPEAFDTGNFLSGYSFTVGYASALGPIQLSAMYNDQSRNFSGYVNVGFHF
jgi:NTE family protein